MPNLTDQTGSHALPYSIYPGGVNKALALLSDIRVGTDVDGQGEDALSVLNRKLESAGILGSGTGNPTFGASSPLIYHQTTSGNLWLKGTSSYTELADSQGLADDVILGIGATTPTYNAAHSAAAPLIFYNTSTAELWAKNTGRYTQITLTAGDIGYDVPSRSGNIPRSVDTVADALDVFHDFTASGGGQTVNQQPSDWDATSGVTRILNKPDIPPFQIEEVQNPSGAFTSTGSSQMHPFALDNELTSFATRYGENLFVEGFVRYYTQLNDGGNFGDITLQLQVQALSSAGIVTLIDSDRVTIRNGPTRQYGIARITGIVPTNTATIRFDTSVPSIDAPPRSPVAGVEYYRLEVKSTWNADEIRVNQSDLGNNLTNVTNVEDVISQVDEFPIQHTQSESLDWPSGPDGIDDNGGSASRQIALHSEIRNAIERGHNYVARIRYGAQFAGSAGDGRTDVDFDLEVFSSLAPGTALEPAQSITDQTDKAFHTLNVSIPTTVTSGVITAPTSITLQFTVPGDQSDARLVVTDCTVDIEEGIDGSNDFGNPNDSGGGLRGIDISGYSNDPNNVRDALRVADRRLQDVWNPFEKTELIDHEVNSEPSPIFNINSSTIVYSNEITIPVELRRLSTDIDIRIGIDLTTLGSSFVGDIALTSGATTNLITGVGTQPINNTAYSQGSQVIFQRRIAAANVPNTYRVRFRRTSTGSTNNTAIFDNGFANMIDSLGGQAMGGAGGQSASYSEAIIWLAGAGINDRLITSSETIDRTLISGHFFGNYDIIQFVFDAGPGGNQPLIPTFVTSNLFQAAGSNGILWIVGQYWLMVSKHGTTDNIFRWRWRAGVNGLRRIIGISTT